MENILYNSVTVDRKQAMQMHAQYTSVFRFPM